jgi:hypothetical protein
MESDSGTSWVIDAPEAMVLRFQKFDWSSSTVTDRQALFVVCNEIRKQEHWTWARLLKEASITNTAGADYQQNFRRGKISKANAAKLYEWVFSVRPHRASELHSALKQPPGPKSSQPPTAAEAYKRELFGLNYAWGGPKYKDEPWPVDDDPDPPPYEPERREKRKKP